MARQKGLIKLKGTLGDITFYKSGDGFLAREKGSLDRNRIQNDPAFQRTRENGYEFGRAGKAGKVLRTAFRPLLLKSADSRMVSRLTQMMMKVLQADAVSVRGQRNVIDGETELLTGFEFNTGGTLGNSLYAPFTTNIDRATGTYTLTLPPFVPNEMVTVPDGTTHFTLNYGAASIDFELERYEVALGTSAVLPWNGVLTADLSETLTLTANSTHPLFMVVGISFFQEINGSYYPLRNGAYNPLSIVQVSGVPTP